MAGNLRPEKGICLYLLFVIGLDNAITWPISCVIISELFKIDQKLLGVFSGLFVLAYGVGKGISFRLADDLSKHFKIRSLLFLGFLGLAISEVLFCISNNLALMVFSRLLSGLFSNTQGCVRKLLLATVAKEGLNDLAVFRKAIIAQRVGFMAGVLISSILFNLEAPVLKEISSSKLAMTGISVVFLDLTGIFLVFFLDTSIQITQMKNRYAELPEIKYINDNIESDRQTKEKVDPINIFNPSILSQENAAFEENIGPEDVKFYSPRVVNQPKSFKKIQSARPQLGSTFDFPERSGSYNESEVPIEESKKVHISFLEEDFENEEKNDSQANSTQIVNPPVENVSKKTAIWNWVVFSVSIGCSLETVPVSAFLSFGKKGSLFTTYISAICLILALGCFQITIPRIMQKVSVYSQIIIFSAISCVIFLTFPIVTALSKDPILFVPLWIFLIFSAECLSPAGLILITDSISLAEREKELYLNGKTCILFKAVFSYLSGVVLTGLSYYNLGMVLLSAPYLITIYYKKHFQLFPCVFELPYKT